MMKRFVTLLIILCLALTPIMAEGESIWDSIGGWFGQAWEDTTRWVSQAWSDASKWVEGAWGDASKWVEQAWNDSSKWVTDIWGDVSAWISESYESATGSIGVWWAETFKKVTQTAYNTWGWLADESSALSAESRETLSNIRDAVSATGTDAEAKVKDAFAAMLGKLQLSDEDSQKVWKTVQSYAEQNGISQLEASKIALPYLLQLTIDGAESKNNIPAVAVAQYLTAVFEKLNVTSTEAVSGMIDQLNEVLGRIE